MMALIQQLVEEKHLPALSLSLAQLINNMDNKPQAAPAIAGLSAALLVQELSNGHSCLALTQLAGSALFNGQLQLPEQPLWLEQLQQSPAVGQPGDNKPLILEQDRLYLHRQFTWEQQLAEQLLSRSHHFQSIDLDAFEMLFDQLFPAISDELDWQRVAAAIALVSQLLVVTGGPGTGKTTTVTKILLLLLTQFQGELSIALAAPTGKAASRLSESINSSKTRLQQQLQQSSELHPWIEKIPSKAVTLHRLLGKRSGRSEAITLPHDLVVVDEASMVDLALMTSLLKSLKPDARLILLGDKDQLESVEAGAVLGDLCANTVLNHYSTALTEQLKPLVGSLPINTVQQRALNDSIVCLQKSYRFDAATGIGQLAKSVINNDYSALIQTLSQSDNVSWLQPSPQLNIEQLSSQIYDAYQPLFDASDIFTAFEIFNRYRVLCAHRVGPFGNEQINRLTERHFRHSGDIARSGQWYRGRPVIITRNDATNGLFNGDIGLTWPDSSGQLRVHFPSSDGSSTFRCFSPAQLPFADTVYAMTVHRSQGSEFDQVFLIFPAEDSAILTRNLLYTAITRAKTRFSLLSSQALLKKSLNRKTQRHSGLAHKLQGDR